MSIKRGRTYLLELVLELVDLREGLDQLLLFLIDGLLGLGKLFLSILPLELDALDVGLLDYENEISGGVRGEDHHPKRIQSGWPGGHTRNG